MIYTTIHEDLFLQQIKEILLRTGLNNAKPEVAILGLLKGHWKDWQVLLHTREEILQEAQNA